MRDHPRSRGVYRISILVPGRCIGSSPLARGLPRARPGNGRLVRIIPARAGFTRRAVRRARGLGDHPRSRGVYLFIHLHQTVLMGSSPLARGLRRPPGRQGPPRGIIPARAGFTRPTTWSTRSRPDHPRSRGVYWTGVVQPVWSGGSSPLARGLQEALFAQKRPNGIIPARAGFTDALS